MVLYNFISLNLLKLAVDLAIFNFNYLKILKSKMREFKDADLMKVGSKENHPIPS